MIKGEMDYVAHGFQSDKSSYYLKFLFTEFVDHLISFFLSWFLMCSLLQNQHYWFRHKQSLLTAVLCPQPPFFSVLFTFN